MMYCCCDLTFDLSMLANVELFTGKTTSNRKRSQVPVSCFKINELEVSLPGRGGAKLILVKVRAKCSTPKGC